MTTGTFIFVPNGLALKAFANISDFATKIVFKLETLDCFLTLIG